MEKFQFQSPRIKLLLTKDKITSIQKSGPTTFSIDEIQMLNKKALELGNKLRDNLDLWQYKVNIE
jgi:hypothetical protein